MMRHGWKLYERLVAFKENHNHIWVPHGYARDRELGVWVFMQHYRKENV